MRRNFPKMCTHGGIGESRNGENPDIEETKKHVDVETRSSHVRTKGRETKR